MSVALVLTDDVVIASRDDLRDDVRRRLAPGTADFVVTRSLSRATSISVDREGALLLEEFRAPRTVDDAVVRYAEKKGRAPKDVLVEGYPLLKRLWDARFLVRAGENQSGAEKPRAAVLSPGDSILGLRVTRALKLLEETELAQAVAANGDVFALKIARGAASDEIARETAVYEVLTGDVAPERAGSGVVDGRPYLLVRWFSGASIADAADEARKMGDYDTLKKLITGVADAYAKLHEHGVLHGDIHPGNVLADSSGVVKLIDFGFAWLSGTPRPMRAGVGHYFEPEHAKTGAPSSTLGEQYAVAALLYRIATGAHYLDFALERRALMKQILEDAPLSFAEHGQDWPDLEAALRRALAKEPAHRFATMRDFARALEAVSAPATKPKASLAVASRDFPRDVCPGGALYRTGFSAAPKGSVNFGAGGIAYALWRLACLRGDPELLSAADVWVHRARRDSIDGDYSEEHGLGRGVVGDVSIHHTVTGVHVTAALIHRSLGDAPAAERDATAFSAAASLGRTPRMSELALGNAGLVLASAWLSEYPDARALGESLVESIWGDIESMDLLGIAHGRAGVMHAILAFSSATNSEAPSDLKQGLDALFTLAMPVGRGLCLPQSRAGHGEPMPGWCGGSAGYVHLALASSDVLGETRSFELAERFGYHATEHPDGRGDLCCGLGGRAYALLRLYRATGDKRWLRRAEDLSRRAQASIERSSLREESLYRGKIGVELLAAEIRDPLRARMPFFEA